MQEWAKHYEPKIWTKYEVPLTSDDYKELCRQLADPNLEICGEESEVAARYWRQKHSVAGLFFFDTEQILGMDMDKAYGSDLFGILTKEWRGNPSGSLVLSVYSGVYKNPPTVTVGVAKI